MGLLAEKFRNNVSKSKDIRMSRESDSDVSYPTGFLAFDFLNGVVVHVQKDDMKFTYNSIGIVDGSMATVIGRSGCGNTTFCVQAAGEIISPFDTSCIYYDSIEGGIVETRIENLTGFYGKEFKERMIIRNSGITAENFFERIKMVHDLKIESKDEYMYDTGLLDTNGEKIYKFEPTIYILDSLGMLMPDQYANEDELSGQMSTTASAKTNSAIFRRIIALLKSANIILLCINHILDDVDINPFAKKQQQLAYLKPGERVGGGKVALYVSNLIIRMDDHSKMKPTEGFCIRGSLVTLTIMKSRTSAAGNSITLVFDYEKGFDKDLSLFYTMKELGYVNGAGAYLYFGDRSDIKFAQKNFKQKLQENPELQEVFITEGYKALMTLINDSGEPENYKAKFNVTTALINKMKEFNQIGVA